MEIYKVSRVFHYSGSHIERLGHDGHEGTAGIPKVWTLGSQLRTITSYHLGKELSSEVAGVGCIEESDGGGEGHFFLFYKIGKKLQENPLKCPIVLN